jgi:pimeloyl-ACP methyl ester carboxylesterase
LTEPIVLIHGFTGEPRSWDPLRARLERDHLVLAPATLGHCGGPPLPERLDAPREAMADALERDLDAAGLQTAHLVGSSLGGQLALELAGRGRARSVVALAPGGGWTEQRAVEKVGRLFRRTRRLTPWAARNAERLVARPGLRRLVFRDVVSHGERIPAGVARAMLRGSAECAIFDAIIASNEDGGWRRRDIPPLDVPVRVVWGTRDRILPIEHASAHWRETLSGADWVELEGAGHLPWFDDLDGVEALVREWVQRAAADQAAASAAGAGAGAPGRST